eukprot:symbB.v1.2.005905.t1/scaffold329.1/size228424/15
MGPKIGPVLYNVLDSHNPSHEQTSFLFGWFGSRAKHADLMPESIIKRLHPDIQAEFAKKPKLRRGFAKEMQMSLKHSQAHGEEAVEEFRTLLNDNIQELNRVVDEEGPEHLQQLLKHAEMTMSEHQQATPWQMAQRLGLAMAPVVLLPVKGCVGFRVGRHPTFNVRCLFVVRNDGSPDEDFSYIRCVDRVPSFETKCQQRVCRAIIALLQVNPEAKTKLADLVAPRFPALRGLTATVPRHRNWARCLLSLCSQMLCSQFEQKVLLVVKMLVDRRELIMFLPLLIVRSMVEVDADICKLEDEPPEGGAEHGQDYDYDSMANILDCQVMLFFEFLQTQLAKAPKDASQEVEDRIFEEQRELVIAMMIIFDHVLLQTHNVRCVQFLWFYLSSMSPVWAEGFLQTLLLVGARKTEMAEKRCRAFSYLASFVARAKFLNAKFALKCCEHLAVTGNALYEALELGNIAPLSKDDVFRILASLVQAFCYIIIWKAKEIHEETDKNGVKVLDLVLPEVGPMPRISFPCLNLSDTSRVPACVFKSTYQITWD